MILGACLLCILLMGKLLPLRRPTGSELSDASLLHACALGDMAALGLLFDRLHDRVYRFLARLLGPGRPELEDLVQATFLEVCRAAPNYKGQAAVSTWVIGIAANLARRHARGEQRRRGLHALAAEQPVPDAGQGQGPGQGKNRPDEEAERRQLLARLQAALDELPQDLRTAFVLCELEEVPGVEAAKLVGVPAGTLWRRLHEARLRLRAALDGGT